MKKRDMIRYLRQADAEDIAKNWPHPDDGAGERIYEKCRRSVKDLPDPAETVQGETEIVQHTPVWRYAAAAAAVVLVVGGSVGGISLMQHMHSMEPVPTAEEQSAATVGSEPDTQAEPVFMEGIAEDRAATEPEKPQKASEALAIVEHTTDASEPVTQAATDASGNAAKSTTPASDKPANGNDPTEAANDHAARMDRAYELLMQFAEEHEHIEVYRTAKEYFEAKTGVGLKDLDDQVLVVYPCNYEDICLPAIEQFLKEKGIDDVAATYSGERESTRQTEGRITLAEAEHICRESAKAQDAAECIWERYEADENSGLGEVYWRRFYVDDARTASIVTYYNNGMCIFYQAPGESDSLNPQEHRILTAAGGQLGSLLNWQRLEMEKSDSVLTNDQKAQLRALEQEESSLWCIFYIRRRLEIIGAMSPDAPHLTLEDAEYLCAHNQTPELAARWIRELYVPDYGWGSGVDGYAYVLSDHETINIVNGSSIYYEDTSTAPVTHRDLYE
ncbi:MAG: hypothetical protein J5851_09440 [Oscillospiraceae bacterium]|nr:hypothetical protein [Oscillospiraceae bacterium]